MTRSSLIALAAWAALAGQAVRGDDATPVAIEAGSALNLCQAGLARCPASSFLCDDPKVALIENRSDGAVLKGVAPGTTTCAVLGLGMASRSVLRVTVAPAPKK
jgi:hypothetical protein